MSQAIMPHSPARRRSRLLIGALVTACLLWVCVPQRADAHPLGNFTINHFSDVLVGPRLVTIRYVVDMAEIPSLQRLQDADVKGDKQVDAAEKQAVLAQEAARLAPGIVLEADGTVLPLTVAGQSIEIIAGQGGLPTLRIELQLETPAPYHDAGMHLTYHDTNDAGQLGWHEIVVRNGNGVRLDNADVPSQSVSDELRQYPADRLANPLDVRSASWNATLDPSVRAVDTASTLVPAPAPAVDQLGALTSGDLTPPVITAALLVAFLLGAGHALTPGHGKTIVGAYLVGSRGTPRHAVILGLATTLTHTAGVFALGLITLFAAAYIVPERILPWFELVSGLLVFAIGVSLVRQRAGYVQRRLRERMRRPALHLAHSHGMPANAAAPALLENEVGGEHQHEHSHAALPHSHDHDHVLADWIAGHRDHAPPASDTITLKGLIGLGVSGGLLPCPSALVLLLGAIAIGRVGFGLVLVLAFSLGLAAVLTGVGLLLVFARRWFDHFPTGGLAVRFVPILSALFITVLGAGLTVTAILHLID